MSISDKQLKQDLMEARDRLHNRISEIVDNEDVMIKHLVVIKNLKGEDIIILKENNTEQ